MIRIQMMGEQDGVTWEFICVLQHYSPTFIYFIIMYR